MSYDFDLIVIGAGPGGYVAAIRAAQCGLKTAIIDKRDALGGTCLNVGCIPSKALLESSEHYHQAKTSFKTHGIDVKQVSLNLKQMMARKTEVVTSTTKGIAYLMSKNKITSYQGTASFIDTHTIAIKKNKSTQQITGKSVLIATGSEVMPLPTVPFDGKHIISSDEALSLKTLPKSLAIIGGGVIGVEMGSIYARLGTKVTIIEFLDRIIPNMDKELSKHLQRSLTKLGIEFHLKTKVTGAKTGKTGVTLQAETTSQKTLSIKSEVVLVSIGRRAYTDNLNLAAIGITPDERGKITINDDYQTDVPHIYAIGDVVQGAMLAHKASEEGVVCVEKMVGQKPHLNYNCIPDVVYTWPEVSAVGQTEDALKSQGIAYKTGKFPFKASGRARAAEETEGFVKVLSHPDTDEVLGIHMIGPRCADMIGEAVIAMEYRASAEDIGRITHAHPTFTEAIKEAALMAHDKHPIHI